MRFTGTEHYFNHWSGAFKYTDGVQHFAEKAEAFWLMDLIASYQVTSEVKGRPFQVWECVRYEQREGATVEMKEDSNLKPLVRHHVEYTDLPLKRITLWLCDGVLLLPSEY